MDRTLLVAIQWGIQFELYYAGVDMAAKAKGLIKLDQTKKTVYTTSTLEYDQPIVFEFFNKVPADKYDETFMQALVLGCYALSQEKIAAMLDYTARELDGGLQSLRQLMDLRNMKQSGTAKGAEAEEDISTILQNFSDERSLRVPYSADGAHIAPSALLELWCRREVTLLE